MSRAPSPSSEHGAAVLSSDASPVYATVYVGKRLTLASWTAHNGSPGTPDVARPNVCGEPVLTAIAHRRAESVEVHDPKNHWISFPAATTLTVAFTHAGVGVIARWTVDDADRPRLREAEERFFASFRCE